MYNFLLEIIDSDFLISPIVYKLIKNFTFKNEFLSYCSSIVENRPLVISWEHLQSFFLNNNWNWLTFINSNLLAILFEKGFVLSASIKQESIYIENLQLFFVTLTHFSSFKIVFDKEMLSFMEKETNKLRKEIPAIKTSSNREDSLDQNNSIQLLNFNPQKIVKNPSITIFFFDLGLISRKISIEVYQRYYKSRFLYLDNILKKNFQELKNRPKLASSNVDIEINERIYITGIVTQISLTSTQLYSTKLQLDNPLLDCTIVATISIQQQSKIPLGMVLGIIGKVIDINHSNNSNIRTQINISSENWTYPGIQPPSKKNLPKIANESWIVIIGSINFSNKDFPIHLLNKFIKWLQTIHENFRIKYCIFTGGILSSEEFQPTIQTYDNNPDNNFSPSSSYALFNSLIKKIPSHIEVFFVPSKNDMTNQFLPQPPMDSSIQSHEENMNYLQNPNIVNLEDKTLLLYNPYQFFQNDQFLTQPEKFGIELLNYRHLCPVWDNQENNAFPYILDPLVIPDDIDFFIFNHPNQSILSTYKNINILSVPSNFNHHSKEFQVVICNLHTQERKIISIPL